MSFLCFIYNPTGHRPSLSAGEQTTRYTQQHPPAVNPLPPQPLTASARVLNHAHRLDDRVPRGPSLGAGGRGQGGPRHHEQGVLPSEGLVADGDAVHVLPQKALQLPVLLRQDLLLLLQDQALQQDLVVALPEAGQVRVVRQGLGEGRGREGRGGVRRVRRRLQNLQR